MTEQERAVIQAAKDMYRQRTTHSYTVLWWAIEAMMKLATHPDAGRADQEWEAIVLKSESIDNWGIAPLSESESAWGTVKKVGGQDGEGDK